MIIYVTPTVLPTTQQTSGQTSTNPTANSNSYEEWATGQPKDSHGILCSAEPSVSRCKYECSVVDYWVDDHLRIFDKHLEEYKLHLNIYGPDSENTKIWEDAVIKDYNMIYDECKNSPKFSLPYPL
jgi:hypothetical protein